MKPGDLVRAVTWTDQYVTDDTDKIAAHGLASLEHHQILDNSIGIVLGEPVNTSWAPGFRFVKWASFNGTVGWTYGIHLEVIQ